MERALFILFLPLGVISGVKRPYKKMTLKKEKIRQPNDAWKGYLKTWGLEPPAARVNVLMNIELWPAAMKLNP